MKKNTGTLGRLAAGAKAGTVALAAVASLHLGVIGAAAASGVQNFTVPLCVSSATLGSWGQVGSMAAIGGGNKATGFNVRFTDTRIGHDGAGGVSVVLYATARTFSNPIGGGTLSIDPQTGLVSGTVKLYQALDLSKVKLETDTFRLEGGGLNPDKGIIDCIG